MDIAKLKGMRKQVEAQSGKRNTLFLNAKDLTPDGTYVRLLGGTPSMDGIYFVQQIKYWIDGKSYTSLATFNESCPIADEIAEARETKDPELLALLNAKNSRGMPIISEERNFLMNVIELDIQDDDWGDDDELLSFAVQDDRVKILSVKPQMHGAIFDLVIARGNSKIADRVKGFPLLLSKTGKGLGTKYSVQPLHQSIELEKKYFVEGTDKGVVDLVEFLEKSRKSEQYLRSVIRNYLYGETIIEDEGVEEEEEEEEVKPRRKTVVKAKAKPAARKKKTRTMMEELDEEDDEAKDLDEEDLEDLDDLDD